MIARRALLTWLLVLLAWPLHAPAQIEHPDRQQAWLVTYGPGDVYWQRFGHNAIWLRDPRTGLDHTFNFGYFDFAQERFITRFIQGRMLYFSHAQPAVEEFVQYREQGRSIRTQRLALDRQQFALLRDHLLESVRPENRNYRYDYYLDNCSTRVRDALDLALGGRLRAWAENQPARLNFRQHTLRLTGPEPWLYWGTQAPLGRLIDRPMTLWDEFFIPAVLADSLVEFSDTAVGQVVLEDQWLNPSSLSPPPPEPEDQWWLFGLASILLFGLGALAARSSIDRGHRVVAAWLVLGAAAGAFMLYAWFMTDHWAARENWNLLLFNPLWLLGLIPGLKRPAALLLIAGVAGAAWAHWMEAEQYLLDVLVLAAPLNLGAAYWLLRYGGRPKAVPAPSTMGTWT